MGNEVGKVTIRVTLPPSRAQGQEPKVEVKNGNGDSK